MGRSSLSSPLRQSFRSAQEKYLCRISPKSAEPLRVYPRSVFRQHTGPMLNLKLCVPFPNSINANQVMRTACTNHPNSTLRTCRISPSLLSEICSLCSRPALLHNSRPAYSERDAAELKRNTQPNLHLIHRHTHSHTRCSAGANCHSGR